MKVILHIGMGKTGTSSIQRALQENSEALAAQDVRYLGRWFDLANREFEGRSGLGLFFACSPQDMSRHAQTFATAIEQQAQQDGIKVFILSNESIFANAAGIKPFITCLRKLVDLHLIAYVRDPRSWLPSAYTQWGISHKTYSGPIQSYRESAGQLIGQYYSLQDWVRDFDDIMTVHAYEKAVDVVQDFARAAQIEIRSRPKRFLERAENTEVLLRAMFNNRYHAPIFPDRFRRTVINTNRRPVAGLDEMISRCFDHGGTHEIISENAGIFDYIRERFGIDYSGDETPPATMPGSDELHARLLDYLVEITLDQANRIARLEHRLKEMEQEEG